MDLVYAHRKSGGEIWQGGAEDVEEVRRNPSSRKIDVVVLMASDYQPRMPGIRPIVLRGPIRDHPRPELDEFTAMAGTADVISDHVAKHLLEGRKILSSCAMGLNRSGLVTAMTLMKVVPNATADAVIRLVRRARGAYALSNPAFVAIIKGTFRP